MDILENKIVKINKLYDRKLHLEREIEITKQRIDFIDKTRCINHIGYDLSNKYDVISGTELEPKIVELLLEYHICKVNEMVKEKSVITKELSQLVK